MLVYEKAWRVLESATSLRIVSHHDLDGVVSATLLARWARSRGVKTGLKLVSVSAAYKVLLGELKASNGSSTVVAADFSPGGRGEAEAIASSLKWARGLVWLDHHMWSTDIIDVLEGSGAVVVVDPLRVTAEITCSVIGCYGDSYARTLVEIARVDDMCINDPEGLAARWRLVLRLLGPGDAVRVVEALTGGELWPTWADELYNKHAPGYYDEIKKRTSLQVYTFDELKVLVLTPPPTASACDVELLVEKPEGVDVVLLLYPKGLSIRTSNSYRADCIASRLGGGGHPRAAGARRPSASMGPGQLARIIAKIAKECRES